MEFGKLTIRNISTLIEKKNTVFRNPKKPSVGVISIFIKEEKHELDTYSNYSYDALGRYSSNYLLCWHIANLVEFMVFQYCLTIHNSIKKLLSMKKTFAKKVVVNIKRNVFDALRMCT